MSFGFSIGDIVMLTQLGESLISRIRHAPAQFREFEGDLNLTCTILRILRDSWPQFTQSAAARGLNQGQNQTLHGIITGIDDTLKGVQTQLEGYSVGPSITSVVQNIQFTGQLQGLKDRLVVYMSALQLVMQKMILAQGYSITETLGMIQEGMREEAERRVHHGDEQIGDRGTRNRNERLRPPRAAHPSLRGITSRHEAPSHSIEMSSTVSSRDYLIERWRREVPFGLVEIARTERLPIDNEYPELLALSEVAPSLADEQSYQPEPRYHPGDETNRTASRLHTISPPRQPEAPPLPEAPPPPQPAAETEQSATKTSPTSLSDDTIETLAGLFFLGATVYMVGSMIVSLVLPGYLFGKEASGSSGWDAPKSIALPALIVSCVQWAVVLLFGLVEFFFRSLRFRALATALCVLSLMSLGFGIWSIHETRTKFKITCGHLDSSDCEKATKISFAIGAMHIIWCAYAPIVAFWLLYDEGPDSVATSV